MPPAIIWYDVAYMVSTDRGDEKTLKVIAS